MTAPGKKDLKIDVVAKQGKQTMEILDCERENATREAMRWMTTQPQPEGTVTLAEMKHFQVSTFAFFSVHVLVYLEKLDKLAKNPNFLF